MSNWYQPLKKIASLGSQHAGAGSLAGLHQARQEHLAQFFTPDDVAAFMWEMAVPAMKTAIARGGEDARVSLLDNSVGAGRLLQFANPQEHTLAGCDIHEPTIEALASAAQQAGFNCDFVTAPMQDVRLPRYNVALINPPFSIPIDSPNLTHYPVCSRGRFGDGSSCVSHVYALAQALDRAQIVIALLPSTFAAELRDSDFFSPRLRALFRLPADAFKAEGATVNTTVAVFDSGPVTSFEVYDYTPGAAAPDLGLFCRNRSSVGTKAIEVVGVESSEPTIILPVTGNSTVRLVKQGRRIGFKFACGLVQAKVLNAIYARVLVHSSRPAGYRYPKALRFAGEGKLDLQVHLAQPDPLASFNKVVLEVKAAGGSPVVAPEIPGYLARQARKIARHRVPFAHTVLAQAADLTQKGTVSPRKSFAVDAKSWSSPVFKAGTQYPAVKQGAAWQITLGDQSYPFTSDEVSKRFTLSGAEAAPAGWVRKFTGRSEAFPAIAHNIKARASRLKLDSFLSWDYQFADLVELAISPYGGIAGWEMGLGKSRLCVGLCLIHGGPRNLYVTEPHLIAEVIDEITAIGLSSDDYQVIDSPEKLKSLKRINLITYNRLRLPVAGGKRTYAHSLRRRISTMVVDEGHHLRNNDSDRSRAVWQVSATHRYISTGTPVANYPRDVFYLMLWLGGDGTAANPYGLRNAFMEENHILTMREARRGLDAFLESYVTTEWVTHEFRDSLTEGAKREVPKIANLGQYRKMLAPWVKRRVVGEPEVAKYITIPPVTKNTQEVDFSDEHLGFYLRVADGFNEWFKREQEAAGKERRNVNLIALLARIGAVEQAGNNPADGVNGFGSLAGLTTKQVAVMDRAQELIGDGRKTIIFAESPRVLDRLAAEAAARGIDSVVVHGGRDIAERTKELREKFRFGNTKLLLASLGCCQTGLNIPEAGAVLFYNRDWRAVVERQALARALRPQQKEKVICEFFHLRGSIDEYQAQMVAMKGDAADAGLDWAAPQHQDAEFLHLDHVLSAFVANLTKLRGVSREALRKTG